MAVIPMTPPAEPLGRRPDGLDPAEADRLEALFRLQQGERWRHASTTAADRRARLARLADAFERHADRLADAVHRDFGKPYPEIELTDLRPVREELRHTMAELDRWMAPEPVATPLELAGTRSEVRYEPKGTVLVLSPWNYPVHLLLVPTITALAAGNSVVARPSEKVPETAAALEALFAEAFDPSVAALVQGEIDTARFLTSLPFDHVFFTGSTAVGRKVAAAAAEHLASVTLELGGKSPVVVDRSADLDAAARRLAWGKALNAGQTCIAPDHVLVHEDVADQLAHKLGSAFEAMFGRTPSQRRATPDLARLVDQAAYERVVGLIDRSVEAGARVAFGGGRDPEDRYIEPTVLTRVREDHAVMGQEIFGPVLPILRVSSIDDALASIHRRAKPLALYVFAQDPQVVERTMRATTAGGTVVNHVILHITNPALPFGGVGPSGQGRYHGRHGFREMSNARSVLRQGAFPMADLLRPPYDGALNRATRALVGGLDRLRGGDKAREA